MTQVSVVAPDGGEAIQLGPIQMRILEDGKTTGHRLGVGEITIPPGTAGPGSCPSRRLAKSMRRNQPEKACVRQMAGSRPGE